MVDALYHMPGPNLAAAVVSYETPSPGLEPVAPTVIAYGARTLCGVAELDANHIVGNYRITAKLGAGGMGSVYRVEHVSLGRAYALKVLNGHLRSQTRDSAAQFLNEARAAARVRHPHVVDIFDFGYLPDGRSYFVMELLGTPSVAGLLEGRTPEIAQAVAIALQLAQALAAVHDQGVVHGDVSSSNVLVEPGTSEAGIPHVKLVDFGLARVVGPGVRPPQIADIVYGTPAYIAPEVARGHAAEVCSDQYSFGVLLYELLAGAAPFIEKDIRALCRAHIYDPLPAVRSPHGRVPDQIAAIVERCCAKSPAVRFPDMHHVATALADAIRALSRKQRRRWFGASVGTIDGAVAGRSVRR